ncbi:MAG: septum formation initiator family protein [Alphaproteobacteria bacterium]|nr:septum formation initiator family protein [Alphaproteobacteria bacterium]
MNFKSRHFQRISQKAIAPFLALSLIGYFIYHSIQGDRGILAWVQLQERLANSLCQLSHTVAERKALEEIVQELRPESINRDLLDQQVRLQLGYAHPDEIVILQIEKEPKPKNDEPK